MDYSQYFWQGDLVRLRPLHIDDIDCIYEGQFDSPTRQALQLGTELPTSKEATRGLIEKYSDCKDVDGIIIFAVEDHDGQNVGGISFHSRNRKNGTFSIGVVIYRAFERKGYAADATRILLRYAFNERNYQKFNSACISDNNASLALHRKLGCTEEGKRTRMFYYDGRFHDEILFGLTVEAFRKHHR